MKDRRLKTELTTRPAEKPVEYTPAYPCPLCGPSGGYGLQKPGGTQTIVYLRCSRCPWQWKARRVDNATVINMVEK